MKRLVTILVLAMVLGTLPPAYGSRAATTPSSFAVDAWYRTELYLGRSRPDGGTVSEDEWSRFLAEVVTPRFADGFTILDGRGQYREKNGKIDVERSEVLVFLFEKKARRAASRKINEIRAAYVKQFAQESVMRVDYRTSVNVSF